MIVYLPLYSYLTMQLSCLSLLASVMNDSTRTEVSIDKSEVDKLVDKIDFGELCNDFECTSSPQVESTARQLVRDILEIREGNRAFACYAVSVKYKVHFSVTLYFTMYIAFQIDMVRRKFVTC